MRFRWTLRKKILIGYGINLVLMVIALLWSLGNIRMLGRASSAVLTPNFRSMLAAENMADALERQDSAVLTYLLGFEDEGLESFRGAESAFLQWLGRAKDAAGQGAGGWELTMLENDYTSYLVEFSELQVLYVTGSGDADAFYRESMFPLWSQLRARTLSLREQNQSSMFSQSSHAGFISNRAAVSTAIIGVVLVALGLSFSFFLSNVIVEPLTELVDAVKSIGEGDYHVTVRRSSSDELGTLAEEFNTMVRKLRAYNEMNVEQLVSEKHKNEAILRSIEDGIVVIDSAFRIININPAASSILNVNPELAADRHFLEVIENKDLFERIRRSLETGVSPELGEGRNILSSRSDGGVRHYMFSIAAVRSRSGSMVGVVLLFKDITKLKELDDLKSEFVMTASHELRTPLTSIEMGVKLLQEKAEGTLDPDDLEVFAAVQEEVSRLKALVADLLDLSRIEAGKLEVEPRPIDPGGLCLKIAAGLAPQAAERGVTLVCETGPNEVPEALGDPDKIGWVLMNLIGNALKYTDTGGTVTVRAEEAGAFVQISVSDTGPGIPVEYQTKIFDKFIQVKTGRENTGTGLGLAISKELVHAHGGAIWVESSPGQGSTFLFTLPAAGTGRTAKNDGNGEP